MDSNSPKPVHNDKEELLLQIKALKERYRIVADNTWDMERWVLPDKTLAYISPSCERITGYSQDEFMQRWDLMTEIIHPDDKEKFILLRDNCYVSDHVLDDEFRIITKNGEIRWLWIVSRKVKDKEGNNLGIRSSSRDVTENVAARNRLKLSEARYRAVVDSQNELILRYSPDGIIRFVNAAFGRFTGQSPEQIIGMNWFDMVDPVFAHLVKTGMKRISPELPLKATEFEIRRYEGSKRLFSWSSAAIFNEEGKLTEIQVTGNDITDLKETEKQLKKALQEVESLKEKLEEENKYLRETYLPAKAPDGIVTDSPLMHDVLEKVKQVAQTDSPVLIYGETGTGKELIAQAIHNGSNRRRRVMITVNCAALPASLIESELFGRERGAYTGALTSQIGRFELADKSTIFLDEIGELPLEIQVKLLRVIQFGEFQMLGSNETKKVDVRIIAATNKDLTKAQADGLFRSDLFYRLNVFPVKLPPLRDRKEDIPLLAWSFVDEIAAKIGKRIDKISTRSMNRMLRHSWPGNIRELRNVIEYSIILSRGAVLEVIMQETEPEHHGKDDLDSEQRRHIAKILDQTGWRIRGAGGAAEKLGMKESTLRFRMKKLGIHRKGG